MAMAMAVQLVVQPFASGRDLANEEPFELLDVYGLEKEPFRKSQTSETNMSNFTHLLVPLTVVMVVGEVHLKPVGVCG